MNEISETELLELCEAAARAGGDHALKNMHRCAEAAERFDHDIKLVMDSECQRLIESMILARFPDHTILGEEGSVANSTAYEWVVDPIDGTSNYTRQFPYWCCSVAVRRAGEMLAGCVYVPALNECYTATASGTALCNGNKIQPAATSTLKDAALFTGLTKDMDVRTFSFFTDAAPRVNKIRILGSAAIDVCHVACGRSDAFFEAGLFVWDIAAAGLIAARAGAVCTEYQRGEEHGLRFLCTTPAVHAEMKELVEKHFGN